MGIVSTMARCMRNNRLSKRLSTSSTKIEEDSNDLIKPTSETASLRPSIESTTTIVHHSFYEALPTESPNRLQLRTNMNTNMRTLFDQTPISPTDRAKEALSDPQYPIFKLDMCQAPFEAPKLQPPMDTSDWRNKSTIIKNEIPDTPCSPATTEKEKKKSRRSMSAMLKKHCGLNIPRSSLSLKANSVSPKWLDSAGVGEDEALVHMKNEKLLDVHLEDQKKNGGYFGRS